MAIGRGQISAQIDGKLRGARDEKKKKKKKKQDEYNELYLYKEVLRLLMKEGIIK